MLDKPQEIMQQMVELSTVLEKAGLLCVLHKTLDKTVPANCKICQKN